MDAGLSDSHFPVPKSDFRSFVVNVSENALLRNTIEASQIWALFLTFFGALGNLVTIGSILYQMKKNKCFDAHPLSLIESTKFLQPVTLIKSVSASIISKVKTLSQLPEEQNINEIVMQEAAANNKNLEDSSQSYDLSSVSKNSCDYDPSGVIISPNSQNYYPRKASNIRNNDTVVEITCYKPFSCRGDTLLLLYLSCTDFICCVIVLPLMYYFSELLLAGQIPSHRLCAASAFLWYALTYGDWLTIALLAIERCVDLQRPPKAKIFTFWPITGLISFFWVLSIVIFIYPLFKDEYGFDSTTLRCDFLTANEDGEISFTRFYFYIFLPPLPTMFIIFGCWSIFIQIWRNRRVLALNGLSSRSVDKKCKDMWNFVALTIGLMVMYLMCLIPYWVYEIGVLFCDCMPAYVGVICFMICWMPYSINFVLYGIFNKNYRRAYKEFLSFALMSIIKVSSCKWSKKFNLDSGMDFIESSSHLEGLGQFPTLTKFTSNHENYCYSKH